MSKRHDGARLQRDFAELPFEEKTIEAAWEKGAPEPNLDTFRKDTLGASIQCQRYGKQEQWGWEIDHIKPVSRGGTGDLDNLQPLQWKNNSNKGDEWPNWSRKVSS